MPRRGPGSRKALVRGAMISKMHEMAVPLETPTGGTKAEQ